MTTRNKDDHDNCEQLMLKL